MQPTETGTAESILCKDCDEPKGNCICIDCGVEIGNTEAEYDHFCGRCSYANARL